MTFICLDLLTECLLWCTAVPPPLLLPQHPPLQLQQVTCGSGFVLVLFAT